MANEKIGVLGSIAVDSIFEAEAIPCAGERVFGTLLGQYNGGIGANQAVEAARYSNNVYMLGALGADNIGNRIMADLRQHGVHTDFIEVCPDSFTGQSFMYLIDGKNDYFSIVTQGANIRLNPNAQQQAVEKLRGGCLLVSVEINEDAAVAAIAAAKSAGVYTYLICSPAERVSSELLSQVDALICNLREAEILLGIQRGDVYSVARQLKSFNGPQKRIIITLGKDGALLLEAKKVYYAPAMDVPVRDSVGAGDAFIGAFASLMSQGSSPYHALCCACIAGAMAISTVGPQTSTHTVDIIETQYQKLYMSKEGVYL